MSSGSPITAKAFGGKTKGRWVTRYKGITFHRNEKREFWRIKRVNKNIKFETDRGKGVSLKDDLAKFEKWDAWLNRGVNPLEAEQADREALDRARGDTFKGHAKQWLEMKLKELKPQLSIAITTTAATLHTPMKYLARNVLARSVPKMLRHC